MLSSVDSESIPHADNAHYVNSMIGRRPLGVQASLPHDLKTHLKTAGKDVLDPAHRPPVGHILGCILGLSDTSDLRSDLRLSDTSDVRSDLWPATRHGPRGTVRA